MITTTMMNLLATYNRGTGRTTRMMEDAIKLAKDGRAVYIIAANPRLKWDFDRRLDKMTDEMGTKPYVRQSIKVEVENETMDNFDWKTLWLTGAHPNCIVLVDHYTIECKFGPVIEEYLRYNKDMTNEQR